jgi:hypothetical protein
MSDELTPQERSAFVKERRRTIQLYHMTKEEETYATEIELKIVDILSLKPKTIKSTKRALTCQLVTLLRLTKVCRGLINEESAKEGGQE